MGFLNQVVAIALLAACGIAQAAPTAGAISLSTTERTGLKPVEVSESFNYPIFTHAQVRVSGLSPGRRYEARAYATEGRGLEFADHSWTFTADGSEAVLSHQLPAYGAYAAGTWTYVFMLDGVKVAERSVQAVRVIPAARSTAPPGVPPPKAASAEVTPTISRDLSAREPLQALGLAGNGVFFLVQATGLTPGHNHQVRIEVRDGKGSVVTTGQFGHVSRTPDGPIWFPVVPAPAHAPGKWSFLMQVDDRDLAKLELEARPGAHQVRGGDAWPRFAWPVLIAALVALPLFIGFQLWQLRGAQAQSPPAVQAAASGLPSRLLDPSLLALVAANLLPLAFVAAGLASAAELLVLYWIENLIVAFYAILRMATARGDPDATPLSRVVMILFFVVHFGMFCAAHYTALRLYVLTRSGLLPLDPHQFLDHDLRAAFPTPALWQGVPESFALLVAALVVSHGVSYVRNFLQRGEVLHARIGEEMGRPYRRMIPLHIATFAGGFFALSQPSAGTILAAMVLVKTAMDAALHVKSHSQRKAKA